jgi:hypothetical protein
VLEELLDLKSGKKCFFASLAFFFVLIMKHTGPIYYMIHTSVAYYCYSLLTGMEIKKKLGQFLCLSNMIGEKFKI